ncbi:MAG: hypothetical protein AAGA95_11260 [Pseudomonadota bacterium]
MTASSLTQRATGLALIVIALIAARDLPRVGAAVFSAGAVYLLLLVSMQRLWLLVLPTFCVLVDLAPWTGRFIYNELDVVFWLTVAAALICARYQWPVWEHWSRIQRAGLILIIAYLLLAVATTRGLSAITSPPGAAYENPYLVPQYGYKVIKGLLWGALLTPLWLELRSQNRLRTDSCLFIGASLASLVLLGVILWERGTLAALASGPLAVWASLSDMGTYYRTIGLFSDMHTGGEALDGTIIVLLAINLYASIYGGSPLLRGVAITACVALFYVTLVGFTRATYAAFALTLFLALVVELFRRRRSWGLSVLHCLMFSSLLPVFFLFSYSKAFGVLPLPWGVLLALQAALTFALMPTQLSGRRAGNAWCYAVLLGVPLVFALGLSTESMGRRMVGMDRDLGTRWEHWGRVLQLGAKTPGRILTGHGAGSFPALYQDSYVRESESIGSLSVRRDQNDLRIRSGGDLIVYQRIPPRTKQLRVVLRARARDGGELTVGICARNILDTGWWGGRCDNQRVSLQPAGEFEEHIVTLIAPQEALSGEAAGWPLALHVRALNEAQPVEFDGIEASAEGPILRNGDFQRGLDYWFFSTDFGHLQFHVKNIWLQFWFDHGVAGLLIMLGLVALLTWRIFRVVNPGRSPGGEDSGNSSVNASDNGSSDRSGDCSGDSSGIRSDQSRLQDSYRGTELGMDQGTGSATAIALSCVAILGMSALGLFGTPLDSARMGWWFYLLLFVGLLEPAGRCGPAMFERAGR